MSDIQKLIDQRANVFANLNSLTDEAIRAGKPVDAQKFSEMKTEFEDLSVRIKQIETKESFSNELKRSINEPVSQRFTDRKRGDEREEFFNFIRTGNREYFAGYTVADSSGTNVKVATPTGTALFAELAEFNVVRAFADVQTYTSDLDITVANTPSAFYTGETGSYQASANAGTETMGAFKVTGYTTLSEELLQDSTDAIERVLIDGLAAAMAEEEEKKFLLGTGVGQPKGLLTLTSWGGVAIASGSTESTSSLSYDVLNAFKYAFNPSYRRDAVWVFESSTVAKAMSLKDDNGTPIFRPKETVGGVDMLLGMPIYETVSAPTWGANKTIGAIMSAKNILVGQRSGIFIQRLDQIVALQGQIGIRCFMRSDVKPKHAKAIYKIFTPAS